jgi:hypothetical protein
MITQLVTWVALPNGTTDDGAGRRLSLFVSPRLRTDESITLAPFVDFLDWPARINDPATTFEIELADGTLLPATLDGAPPDSALWAACFSAATPLRPFTFDDYADRPFVTFSVRGVANALRDIYARAAAASPTGLPRIVGDRHVEPPIRGLLDVIEELGGLFHGRILEGVRDGRELDARLLGLLNTARARSAVTRAGNARGRALIEPLPHDGSIAGHFARAYLFHRRPQPEVKMPADDEVAQHFRETVDFHQMLAALGDHPAMLRRLGLVMDVVVAADAIPDADAGAPLPLRAKVAWVSGLAAGQSGDRRPWTATVHAAVDGSVVFATADDLAAPGAKAPTGLVPLPAAAFALEQVDVDGAALKAIDLAATLKRVADSPAPADRPFGQPEDAGLPALRTGGIALVQTARAQALQADFGRALGQNEAIEIDAPLVLDADDLRRGYRVDVFDVDAGAWRSLHRRVVRYLLDGDEAIPAVSDEGIFQISLAGAATPPGVAPDANGEIYLHEGLATWDGWSLSAPRPGKAVSRSPDASVPPERVRNEALTALGLEIEAAHEPGSLPRLRFGRGYRFRLRTVDLAGNGPTLAEADARMGPAATDPATPPAGAAARYRRFEPVAAPALVPRAPYDEGASLLRLVVRSNFSQSPEAYAAAFNASPIVTVEGHAEYGAVDERHVAPPKASLRTVETHGLLDDVIGSDGQPPDAARRAAIRAAYELARREKGSLETGAAGDPQRDVHPEAQLELPYLPDPFARGAVFFGLPGQPPDKPLVVEFDGASWHEAPPFRIQLAEGSGAPEWDAVSRVLTVRLRQATHAIVRVASRFGGDLSVMGMLDWCERSLTATELEPVVRAMKENRSWLITPWHELRLVHAVQQPLQQPAWKDLQSDRFIGSTVADLFGLVHIHPQSTEKVDVLAEWGEDVDDPRQPGPERREGRTVVFELATRTAVTGRTDVDPRRVPYSLREKTLLTFSTGRLNEFAVAPLAGHQFGDTKYRRVRYSVKATTPFREYFPRAWSADSALLSRTSDTIELDIPASAPPAAPPVLYVVPTQGWERDVDEGTEVRRRRGGGLRVYLARGWYSSGDGEQLGVVVGPYLTNAKAREYPFISLAGQDPIRGAPPLESLRAERLTNAAAVAPRTRLLEINNPLVTIAAFDPQHDPGTDRWFCDIDIDTELAYFPIVRLALVRYQAHALDGCHVSPVVLADIVQTVPDRTLTVTRADGETLDLALSGPSYEAIRGGAALVRSDQAVLARVVARVEERDPDIADDLLGWRAVPGTEVELTASVASGITTWQGSVAPGQAAGPRRVIVVEEDRLVTDRPGGAVIASRVVYADIIEA